MSSSDHPWLECDTLSNICCCWRPDTSSMSTPSPRPRLTIKAGQYQRRFEYGETDEDQKPIKKQGSTNNKKRKKKKKKKKGKKTQQKKLDEGRRIKLKPKRKEKVWRKEEVIEDGDTAQSEIDHPDDMKLDYNDYLKDYDSDAGKKVIPWQRIEAAGLSIGRQGEEPDKSKASWNEYNKRKSSRPRSQHVNKWITRKSREWNWFNSLDFQDMMHSALPSKAIMI